MTHPTPLPAWCEWRVWLGRCSACAVVYTLIATGSFHAQAGFHMERLRHGKRTVAPSRVDSLIYWGSSNHKTSKTQDSNWNLTRWKTCTPEYDIFRQGTWKLFLKHWFALMLLDTSEKHVRQISICYLIRCLIPLWMGPKILYYPAPRWKAIACHLGPGWYSGIYRNSRSCNYYQTKQWQYQHRSKNNFKTAWHLFS